MSSYHLQPFSLHENLSSAKILEILTVFNYFTETCTELSQEIFFKIARTEKIF